MANPEPVLGAVSDRARALLEGTIDVHVHAAPDPYVARKVDARQLVESAAEAGMAGLVLKSHDYPTQPLAWSLNESLAERTGANGLRVYGALALDYPVGELNPQAVDVALRIGTSVIWMPTFDARNWRVEQGGRHFNEREPISVLSDGELVPACQEILDLIGEHDATLASGHLGVDESVALLRDARQRGIRSVVTHASFWMPVEAQRELAALGCYVEQSAVAVMGAERAALFDGIAQQVRDVGSEHVVLSSDLGQLSNPAPVLGLAMWAEQLLSAGFDEASVGRMLRDNPRALLG